MRAKLSVAATMLAMILALLVLVGCTNPTYTSAKIAMGPEQDNPAEAERILVGAVDTNPALAQDAEYWYLLGNAHFLQKDYEPMLEAYLEALELNPAAHLDQITANRRQAANEIFEKTQEGPYREGNFEQVAENLSLAIRLSPDDPAIADLYGIALINLNRYADAIEMYDTYLEVDKSDSRWYAKVRMMTAYERKAMAALEQRREILLSENPDSVLAEKKHQDALETYEGLLSLANEIIEGAKEAQASSEGELSGPSKYLVDNIEKAKIQRAVALIELDRSEEAIAALDASIESDPDNVNLLYEKGQLLFRLERYEEAAEALEPVVKADLSPEQKASLYEHALYRYAHSLLEIGDHKAVVEALQPYLFQGGEISVENHLNGSMMVYPQMYDDLYDAYTVLENEDAVDKMAAVKVAVVGELSGS